MATPSRRNVAGGDGRPYLTGILRDRREREAGDLQVADVALGLELFAGARRVERWTGEVTLADGRRVSLHAGALGPSVAMPALGYSGGFDDGRGLGVRHGEE